ncbi:RNA recognition, RNP-1 [Hirsutella rhossiliensis]|uniref:RNA recognition, RNP-1 n=1 Tax=Hirsutella rhossiliensis TaxID=111463 RepID=A0A9P8SDK6_9HYPO|nr:RNA recognition, RNP-1 [Hirsutella rhossiliensis]KAH0958848.1 RNA recognition, RNP-1 [Hirsutella rhossiliensis]
MGQQQNAGSQNYFHPVEVQQQHGASLQESGPSVVYCQPKPITSGARIPQSQSCGSVLGMLSPASSRCADSIRANGIPFSPASSISGNLTEPRSYAPRTPGQQEVGNDPPPKFDPTGIVNGQQQQNGPHPQIHAVTANQVMAHACPGAEASWPAAMPAMNAIGATRSTELMRLTNTPTGLPLLATAMAPNNFPFIEAPRMANSFNHGVVKLKNIPFSTRRSEVIAFLGRNSKILNDSDEPVHIIMERVTSKTMDAYVEFVSLEEAMKAVEKHRHNLQNGRVTRLGDRPVEVELSSQASLMKDLFPLARGLIWDGVTPQFKPYNHQFAWENFRGFISEEEMVMLIKHVEVPHRSPYSKDCPQRPYECLISTLKKFPWYATDCVTISQRHAVYIGTERLLSVLSDKVSRGVDPVNLGAQLQTRMVNAALACPGFTPLMKDNISWLLNISEADQRFFGQPLHAHLWRHQYSLAPKPGIPLDVIEWYVSVIREQTSRDMLGLSHSSRTDLQEKGQQTDMHWGYFWAELGHSFGPQFDQMTLAQVAHAEFSAVERILSRALPHA